jgi:hypothetical protein
MVARPLMILLLLAVVEVVVTIVKHHHRCAFRFFFSTLLIHIYWVVEVRGVASIATTSTRLLLLATSMVPAIVSLLTNIIS